MALSRLVYRSRAVGLPPGIERLVTLRLIHAKAVAANERNGVTGFLAFTLDSFAQVLEGEWSAVTATFDRISHDKHHGNIALVGVIPCEERLFGRWSMGAIYDEDILREAVHAIGASGDLDIWKLDAGQIVDAFRVVACRQGNAVARSAA